MTASCTRRLPSTVMSLMRIGRAGDAWAQVLAGATAGNTKKMERKILPGLVNEVGSCARLASAVRAQGGVPPAGPRGTRTCPLRYQPRSAPGEIGRAHV